MFECTKVSWRAESSSTWSACMCSWPPFLSFLFNISLTSRHVVFAEVPDVFFVLRFTQQKSTAKTKNRSIPKKCIMHLASVWFLEKNLTVLWLFFPQAPKQWMLDKLRGRWVVEPKNPLKQWTPRGGPWCLRNLYCIIFLGNLLRPFPPVGHLKWWFSKGISPKWPWIQGHL